MGRTTDSQNLHIAFNGGRISEVRVHNPRGCNVSTIVNDDDRLRVLTEEGSPGLPAARDTLVRLRFGADLFRHLA